MARRYGLKMNPKVKYMTYDFYAGEWSGSCGACGTDLFAPTKSAYVLQFSKHTHSDKCLGGY